MRKEIASSLADTMAEMDEEEADTIRHAQMMLHR
jgi:hypothetical protein